MHRWVAGDWSQHTTWQNTQLLTQHDPLGSPPRLHLWEHLAFIISNHISLSLCLQLCLQLAPLTMVTAASVSVDNNWQNVTPTDIMLICLVASQSDTQMSLWHYSQSTCISVCMCVCVCYRRCQVPVCPVGSWRGCGLECEDVSVPASYQRRIHADRNQLVSQAHSPPPVCQIPSHDNNMTIIDCKLCPSCVTRNE